MRTRGTVSLVFDDGYEQVYRNVVPLLRKYKLPAVFAIPLNGQKLAKIEQRRVRPWQKWLELKSAGFEIASHSVNHLNLTGLTDKELDYELKESARKLGATTLIYPGGALDERVVERASQYYTAGRTVHYGFEQVPAREPMRLKSYNFSRNNFSVTKVNLLACYAWLTGAWLIETYHLVDDDDTAMVHAVKTRELARHLHFLSKLPIKVRTIKEMTAVIN